MSVYGLTVPRVEESVSDLEVFSSFHRMLPFSLGAALFSAISGLIIAKTGSWRPVMWISWAIMVLGFGLMIQLDETSNTYVTVQLFVCLEIGFPAVVAPNWY